MQKMVKLRFRLCTGQCQAVQFSVWVPDDGSEPHDLVELLRSAIVGSVAKPGAYVRVECVDSRAFLVTNRETAKGGVN